MNDVTRLLYEYNELLAEQEFDERDLDYSLLEQHKVLLTQLARVQNSGITVFDLYRREHVFVSYNFAELFGYDSNELERGGTEYFNSRIHPDDFFDLTKNGIAMLRYALDMPVTERMNYKLITEYRIRNARDTYVRVIEQHQALELDKRGNIWLSLGVIDVSPNQDSEANVRSQLVHFGTGEIISEQSSTNTQTQRPSLTGREKEVLSLIKEGYLSKEISDRLFISVHTVNTHRQRILEKLNAANSLEAVKYASKLGLL